MVLAEGCKAAGHRCNADTLVMKIKTKLHSNGRGWVWEGDSPLRRVCIMKVRRRWSKRNNENGNADMMSNLYH